MKQHRVLLARLHKDYSKIVEDNKTPLHKDAFEDHFNEALALLQVDVAEWGEKSGVRINVTVECIDHEENVYETGVVRRTRMTHVFGEFESEQDVAFYKMSLGELKPSKGLFFSEVRDSWCFSWRH